MLDRGATAGADLVLADGSIASRQLDYDPPLHPALPIRRDRAHPTFPRFWTVSVKAMERWLQRAGIAYGPVFRDITAWGTLENRQVVDGVRWILLRRA